MIRIVTIFMLLALYANPAAAQKKKKKKKKRNKTEVVEKVTLETKADSAAYAIGVSIGINLKKQNLDHLDLKTLVKAVEAVYAEDTNRLMQDVALNEFVGNYIREAKFLPGKKFLEENAKKEGVVVLPSGLQYEIITEGSGAKPGPTDKVTTHYHGTLIDGKVFDSSVERGQPSTFGVNQVIKGWTEALQLMSVGSKWRLFIPYNLAYGEAGRPPKIPGGACLIFEVELISIQTQ